MDKIIIKFLEYETMYSKFFGFNLLFYLFMMGIIKRIYYENLNGL